MANKKRKESVLKISGDVKISQGDFVAGDKNINVGDKGVYIGDDVKESNIGIGDHNQIGNQVSTREILFEKLFIQIEQQDNLSKVDKDDLKATVEEIKVEVEKGNNANEDFLARRIRNLERVADRLSKHQTDQK